MSITIQRSNYYGPLEPSRLQVLEQTLGDVLQTEYRQFLLRHNGGVPNPSCCVVASDEEFDGESAERPFACFFAAHDQLWIDDTMEGSFEFPLEEAWKDFASECPDSSTVPIGKDVNGSYICIGYTGEGRGRVFFYDHEYEMLRLLAENFSDFLNMLHECDEG